MNKGKGTFADRARAIMAKYAKFKDDPISQRSMDRELDMLAQEQEELKAKQGIGNNPQQMAYGGRYKMFLGGPEKNLDPFPTNYGIVPDPSAFMRQNSSSKDNSSPYGPYADGYKAATPKAGPTSPSVTNTPPEKAKFNPTGALGSAGNVFQLIDDLRNPADKVDYGRVDPSLIDSTIQENNARNTINTSVNNVIGVSNETSQTGGQRLARRSGLESVRRDKLGRALGQIRETTDNMNAQIENRVKEFNKHIDINEMTANEQNKAARKARIASNLNQIGSNFIAKPKAEQNANQVVNNQNARLLNLINSGYLSDYTINQLLQYLPKKTN